jgi:spore coat protein JB
MTEREKLLKQVQICDFAISEAALYLDGYPKNKQALKYYRKYVELREKAVASYEEKYGPLMQGANKSENEWQWINNPWPWEGEV